MQRGDAELRSLQVGITCMTVAVILFALSACQLLDTSGSGDQKPEGMNDYDHAVSRFEVVLDEIQRIQEALYEERWLFSDYGNRPESCDKGPGGQFTILRKTPQIDRLDGPVPSSAGSACTCAGRRFRRGRHTEGFGRTGSYVPREWAIRILASRRE